MFEFKAGSTSQTVYVHLVDSTTFLGKTGLLFSDMTIYYTLRRAAAANTTPATLAAATSAWATGGFKEVDATNEPGLYRFDVPDAALATGPYVVLSFKATAVKDEKVLVNLPAYDPYDAVRLGLTALPNAVPGAANGLFIAGTNAATTASITGNLTGNVSGSVGSVTAGVTLAAGAIQAIWDAATSALTTAGSIGKWILDKLDVVVSTRSIYGGADTTGTTTLLTRITVAPPTAAAIATQVLSSAGAAPISADVKKLNGTTLAGDGALTPWGP